MSPRAVLVPLGILEQTRGAQTVDQPFLVFGHSRETADFIADGLELWWNERQADHPGVRCLQIELDNGPEIASSRTQFMKRLVAFSDRHQVAIKLVYFPPYHSKYNPIERVWGILEQHWNGTLLNTVEVVLRWAVTFTWRGHAPMVRQIEKVYERGVKLTTLAFRPIAARLQRTEGLNKWSLSISPM
jgi:Rhodopirellula transposase DDE domain